jgi:hypothetical protein
MCTTTPGWDLPLGCEFSGRGVNLVVQDARKSRGREGQLPRYQGGNRDQNGETSGQMHLSFWEVGRMAKK